MIKAVIFDVDGTLVDSVDAHAAAWCEAFKVFGHDIDFPKMRAQIGKGADQLMPVFLSPGELERKGKEIEEMRKTLFKEQFLHGIRGFPKVRELFQQILSDHRHVALASSAAGEELQTYKQAAGIEDLVDKETSSDDAPKSKPHPDIFEAAIEKLHGVDRGDIMVIGDTPYDAEAAEKAGLRCIGVLCGGFPEEDLRRAGCVEIYKDPEDLLGHYGEWTGDDLHQPMPSGTPTALC